MGYIKIPNLYQDQRILSFKEIYALEKIDGCWNTITYENGALNFSSRNIQLEYFMGLVDQQKVRDGLAEIDSSVVIYGETYGGKIQKQFARYGEIKYIVFDIQIDDKWLSVEQAADLANKCGLEFVPYSVISTDVESVNKARDMDSMVAAKYGHGKQAAEGVVLRPLFEVVTNNGRRLIAKHKKDEFRETKSKRSIELDPKELEILKNAEAIAEEWVVLERILHVASSLQVDPDTSNLNAIIPAIIQDVQKEAAQEIVWSKSVGRAIARRTSYLVKEFSEIKL